MDATLTRQVLPGPARHPLRDNSVAAASVGLAAGEPLLDLAYQEDLATEVNMNVVMKGEGRYVEIQGTGEETTFSETQLAELLQLAHAGIATLTALQRRHLEGIWPQ